jgi:hypothetical protein
MSWRDWIRTVEIVPAIGTTDPDGLPGQVEVAALLVRTTIFDREDLPRAYRRLVQALA